MKIFGIETSPTPCTTSKTCPGTPEQPAHTQLTDMFSRDKARPDGLCVYCKPCMAWRQRQWKRNNPDKVRAAKALYRKSGPALA